MTTPGAKIEILIHNLGITEREFAKRLGVRESTVSQWIYNTREPRLSTAVKICEVFDISADWLLK